MNSNIRKSRFNDLQDIHDLVVELARFENSEDQVTATLQDYQNDFNNGIFESLVYTEDEKIIGMALFYISYSTWRGKMMHLEDFIVQKNHRNKGIGLKLFNEVIAESKKQNCKILRWEVLDWNKDAIRFYERHGATIESHWWNGKIIF
jgi:GNAT superfamily N-acetyltransferase